MLRVLEGSEVVDHGDNLVVRTPANPAFWWGNFILLGSPPPPADAGRWLARFAEAFPGAGHAALGVDVTDQSAVDPAGFVDAGFRFELNTVMTARSVREPPRPNRAACYRQLAGDDDWRQSVALRVACDTGPDTAADHAFDKHRTAEARRVTEAGHGSWFGGFVNGRLVTQLGLLSDGTGIARFQNVETHPAMRGRGLAGTLVYEAARYGFDAMAAGTLVIVADPGYVAARIYRCVGFTDAESQIGFERPPATPQATQGAELPSEV